MFKTGDKVCVSFMEGVGVVFTDDWSPCYPIGVSFESGVQLSFTKEGFYEEDQRDIPSLFHADGYKPPVGGEEPVRCEFEKGEMVLVRDYECQQWTVSFYVDMRQKKARPFVCSILRSLNIMQSLAYCIKFDLEKVGTV